MTLDHASEARRLHVDQPWRDRAACQGRARVMDPPAEQIKTYRDLGLERHMWREAKEVCAVCPVFFECRAWVLALPGRQDATGVCGGLTEDERQRERRRASGKRDTPRPTLATDRHRAPTDTSATRAAP